jgi:sugar lactone lactonase YvrE
VSASGELWLLMNISRELYQFETGGSELKVKSHMVLSIPELTHDSILVVDAHDKFAVLPTPNGFGGTVHVFHPNGQLESVFRVDAKKQIKDICFDVHGHLYMLTGASVLLFSY